MIICSGKSFLDYVCCIVLFGMWKSKSNSRFSEIMTGKLLEQKRLNSYINKGQVIFKSLKLKIHFFHVIRYEYLLFLFLIYQPNMLEFLLPLVKHET